MVKKNQTNAFTLLEVIISLGLLVLVFGGVISLAILTREAEKNSKNNLIAAFLAREGQELVRYRRDKNYIDGLSAFNSLVSQEVEGAKYYLLISYDNVIASAASSNVKLADPLKYNNGFYQYANGDNTIFRRLITTTYHTGSPAYIDVKVEVYWRDDTKQDIYSLESQLIDWQ